MVRCDYVHTFAGSPQQRTHNHQGDLKDKQLFEGPFKQGIMPWRLDTAPSPGGIAVPGGAL